MARRIDIPPSIGEVVQYDPETGNLTWKHPHRLAGKIAGGSDGWAGYLKLRHNSVSYRCHRIAWFLQIGEQIPEGFDIDHINWNKADNRWVNLRLATPSQNLSYAPRAQRSLPRGVYKSRKRYYASIQHDGKNTYLGHFTTPEDASTAYQKAFNEAHGPEWNPISNCA